MKEGTDLKRKFITEAIKEANKNALNKYKDGGPFGAIIEKDGNIIARGIIQFYQAMIRQLMQRLMLFVGRLKKLGTHDLSGCTLYVNAEPCPMCLSAIIWSNIKCVYFANTKKDAKELGFRDDMMYDFIKSDNRDKEILNIVHVEAPEAKKTFEDFKNNDEKIMY